MIILKNIETENIINLLSKYKEITCTYIYTLIVMIYVRVILIHYFIILIYLKNIVDHRYTYLDFKYLIPLNCIKSLESFNKYIKPI